MSFTNQAFGLAGAAIGAYLSPKNINAGIAVGLAVGFFSVDAAKWLWKNRHDPEVQRLAIKIVSSTTAGLVAYAITGSDAAMAAATGASIMINNAYQMPGRIEREVQQIMQQHQQQQHVMRA